MQPKLLITGATGFVGHNLLKASKNNWDAWGLACQSAQKHQYPYLQNVDLCNYKQIKTYLKNTKPDAIIHLAAHSNPNECQNNPHTDKLNIYAAADLAGLASDTHIPFVFSSSDLIFDGQHAPYDETSPYNPLSRYGEQKVIAETKILQRYDQATICRLPLMFGWAPPQTKCLLRSMANAIKTYQPLKLFVDEVRTPVDAFDAAQGLLLSITQPSSIFHLGGKTSLSRFELGHLLAMQLKINNPNIITVNQDDINMPAPRAKDVSLKSEKAFNIGYSPHSPSDIIKNFINKENERLNNK